MAFYQIVDTMYSDTLVPSQLRFIRSARRKYLGINNYLYALKHSRALLTYVSQRMI